MAAITATTNSSAVNAYSTVVAPIWSWTYFRSMTHQSVIRRNGDCQAIVAQKCLTLRYDYCSNPHLSVGSPLRHVKGKDRPSLFGASRHRRMAAYHNPFS